MNSPSTIVVLIVAVAGALLMTANRTARSQELSPDGQVIEQLRKAGSDLSRPHTIEFFLYFPTEQSANSAAKEIHEQGFALKVEKAAQGSEWLLFLTRSIIPTEAALVALRRKLGELASRYGGIYDGWGSEVVGRD